MAKKEIIVSRPNWLGSEVGIVLKTFTIPTTQATGVVVENGVSVCKSGTIFTTPYYGLLYGDTEIGKEASIMIGGRYIDANLPATASSYETNFKAQGLYKIAEGTVTLPSNGTAGLSKLTAPTLTNVSASTKFTWVAIANAQGYEVYKGDVVVDTVATTDTLEYEYSINEGSYTVVALGDNINYYNSNKSTAVAIS